jgi:ATP-dependent Clp protease ATP-binding subunit ClpB
MTAPSLPKWLRDIRQLLPIRAQFVLSGNIRDLFLMGDTRAPVELKTALWRTLKDLDYCGLLVWNPVTGLSAWPADDATRRALADATGATLEPGAEALSPKSLGDMLPTIHAPRDGSRIALVVDYASRLSGDQDASEEARKLFVAAEKAALDAAPRGTPRAFQPRVLARQPRRRRALLVHRR